MKNSKQANSCLNGGINLEPRSPTSTSNNARSGYEIMADCHNLETSNTKTADYNSCGLFVVVIHVFSFIIIIIYSFTYSFIYSRWSIPFYGQHFRILEPCRQQCSIGSKVVACGRSPQQRFSNGKLQHGCVTQSFFLNKLINLGIYFFI